jgi:hypothetical protein
MHRVGEIASGRLVQHRIVSPLRGGAADLVRSFGAMQAQDHRNALWAVGLRTAGATEASIEEAVAAGEIVRTWPMRGTLHFVAAADLHWMLALLTPRVIAGAAKRASQHGLNEETFALCAQICRAALSGRQELTRDALLARFVKSGVSVDAQRGYHILWRLAQQRLLCFGPPDGKSPTFVLLDDWVPEQKRFNPADPLAELARRYFASHAPAMLEDFVWWSGLKISDVRIGIANAQLPEVVIDGATFWNTPDVASSPEDIPVAHLLPAFDEYLLGYRDRSGVLDPANASEVVPGNNGIFLPIVLINGRVTGTWKRSFKRGAVEITASMFKRPSRAAKDAVALAADAYARFVGVPARVSFT